ncbi:MAG: MFS transporter [Gammaproteobacteria bacterium]
MTQSKLIRSKRFAPLFWTQFLGAFNDNVFRFALIIYVTFTLAERTGMDTRTLVVLTGGVFILPFFLFSALAGQMADKYEKSGLIRHIKSIEIAVMGLGAVGFIVDSYELLLGVLFAMGLQSTFFGPLKYGVLPQHLDDEELTGGNGLIQMGTYIAILGGSVIGGLLAGLGENAPVAIITSIVGIAAAGRCAAQFIPPAPANAPEISIDRNPLTSTWALMRDSLVERQFLVLIGLISTFWFVGATFLSIVPTFGKELLNANEQAVTLLTAAFTIGIGVGSLSCERLSGRRIELGLVPIAGVVISLAAVDVWWVGTPAAPAEPLTPASFFGYAPAARFFLDLVVIGAAGALYIVPLYAALQARVETAVCSRMLAALNVANALFMVTSAVFTIALFALGFSLTEVFGVVAALNLMALVAGAWALPELGRRTVALLRVS